MRQSGRAIVILRKKFFLIKNCRTFLSHGRSVALFSVAPSHRRTFALISVALFLLLCCTVFLTACGKKAPPQLRVFEKPASPENLYIMQKERKLILTWSYPEKREIEIKGFHILRSPGKKESIKDFEKIGFLEINSPLRPFTFYDMDFKPDTAYKYRIVAESMKGVMSEASEASATPSCLFPPPEDIRFMIKNDFIELLWKDQQNRPCYNIYKSYEAIKETERSYNKGPVCGNSFRDDRISPDRTVYYRISRVVKTDIVNEGPLSKEIIIRPEDFIPSSPSDLRIAQGEGKVYLLWKEPPEVWVRGYRVYRKIEGERDFSFAGSSLTPSFIDTNIDGAEGKRISYMIKAVGPVSEGQPLHGDMIYLIQR